MHPALSSFRPFLRPRIHQSGIDEDQGLADAFDLRPRFSVNPGMEVLGLAHFSHNRKPLGPINFQPYLPLSE
jgi:hypothetical protein